MRAITRWRVGCRLLAAMKFGPTTLLVASLLAPSFVRAQPRPPRPAAAAPAPAAKPAYTGLGADSVSPELIAKFAAPPLPRSATARIQALLDVRGAEAGLTTRRGDRQYFNSKITGQLHVWRQDGPRALPVQLTGGEDRTTVAAIAPDDSYIAIHRDAGGEENPGLYTLAATGGALQVVQHKPKVKTELEYIDPAAPHILYYRSNDVDPAAYALYRFDTRTRRAERVFSQPGLWSIADHRGDRWLLRKDLGNSHTEIYEYQRATQQLTPLLGQNEQEDYDVEYGARPGQLIVATNKLGEFQRAYSVENGAFTPISPDIKFDVERMAVDDARARIYLGTNEAGYDRLRVLDARTLKPVALPKLPAADHVRVVGVSQNGRYAQLVLSGAALVPQVFTLDWTTRKLTAWRLPTMPEIDATALTPATLESYPARDGTRIPMFVRRPARCAGPCPVVIDFHGGPEGQARPDWSASAQLYVDAGFTYVQPNVRGSSGYGKAWLHADDGKKRLAVITDIEDAAKFVRAQWAVGGVAPKIGITGGSYGGYATLMGMTYFAGSFDAGAQIVGISNLMTFLLNTAPYRRILRIAEYGDPVADKDALIALSPTTHVGKIRGPLLSIQGVNDPRVPVGEALQIFRALEQRKLPGGLILFADEGHGVSKRENQVIALGHLIAFFSKHLK